MFHKILYPEKFGHHVLLLFYPFRDEKEFLSGLPPFYQNNQESRILLTLTKSNLNHMLI